MSTYSDKEIVEILKKGNVRRKPTLKYVKYKCVCGGIVKAIKTDNKIHSCNIRRCDNCKKRYYSKGILKLKFISEWRETDFKEYANLF